MDRTCNRSSISIRCSSSFDELFDEISANSLPIIHPSSSHGFTQYYSPIQLYYYNRLIFTRVDYHSRIPVRSQHYSYTSNMKDLCRSNNHTTTFSDIGKENGGESAEVEEMLSLLSEEVGDYRNYESKKTFFRIRSSNSRRNEKLMLDRSSSPKIRASRARSDHIDFLRKKRDEGEKRDNFSSEKKDQSKEFTCRKMLNKEISSSRFHNEPNEKKRNASSISEVTQKDRKKEMNLQVNEIEFLDKSLDSFTSSKFLEKTRKTKRSPEPRKKIEEGRTEGISDESLGQACHPDLQTGRKESSNMDFEVKYPLIFKETHNNQTNYIENVHVSRTNFNPAENSHLLSSSSINIGAPRSNFDSANETRQQKSVEMRFNNHKSFTSSMELTEEEIEPTRQYQTLNLTSFKEKHLSKKLSSLEDMANGDKMTSGDKHGETFKLSSTLSSSSQKEGTLPVQIFDSANETRQQKSVEMIFNNHKSFTSSMELTEEEIEPTRQYQTLNLTSFKEKHLAKKLSSLEDIVNGDKITSEDKHGETFKLSSTLSSSSRKEGTLPVQIFDCANETRQQSVEMRLNNHKSFTSSMELTEEEIEPTRQYQTLNLTSFKEKHLSKKLSSLEDMTNGDNMTSGDKHGETFKFSSTLSSSSQKEGTLPVQIFGGCLSGGYSCTIGGDSDVSIRKTDVNLSEDPVINVHNDNSTSNIHDNDKLSRARIVNDRRHGLNPSVNNVYHLEEHDSDKSAGVHHISTSDDPSAGRNYVLKRNGRSLWSVLAEMIRLRWSSISGSHNSNIRSCIGNFSAESANSEEWFSVLEEQAENIHENGETGGKKHPNKTDNNRNIEEVTTPGLSDHSASEKADRAEAGMPPSVITEGRATSRGGYSEYYDDDITYNEDRKSSGSTAFQSVSSTSPPTPLSSIRHLIGYQVGGSVDSVTTGSSTRDCNEVACFVGKEGVPKQRSSKREKHVANGSFGDWEEACTLGSEQHRIDELFMREALLESKKAADAWEVPVGAVLVHGGRIIARGFNLVEEKRDCTAHAEMICIREASNTLNSWRLAGTTLYVTLEPCPMCAGAILQARVGTLVWGAPNKIIGADGSWIRLFRDDNGGREWEIGEKSAPPVHPLHPDMKVRRLVLASECADTMQSLFQLRRRRNKLQESKPASPDPSCTPLYRHTSRILSKIHHVFHIFCV